MQDLPSLWQAVELAPTDNKLKLQLAAELDRRNLKSLATTIRWLIQQNRWPKSSMYQNQLKFYWTSGHSDGVAKKLTHILPTPLFMKSRKRLAMSGDEGRKWQYSQTLEGKIRQLAAVFEHLWQLIPEKPANSAI